MTEKIHENLFEDEEEVEVIQEQINESYQQAGIDEERLTDSDLESYDDKSK